MATPRIKTHTAVVVTAVTLMSKFRRRFLNASRKKNPRLLNFISVDPPSLVTYDPPCLERHYPFSHHVHHLFVMGCDENRGADPINPVQELHDSHTRVRIEVTGGLVGDEYRRLGDEGAGDGDSLLLTT